MRQLSASRSILSGKGLENYPIREYNEDKLQLVLAGRYEYLPAVFHDGGQLSSMETKVFLGKSQPALSGGITAG